MDGASGNDSHGPNAAAPNATSSAVGRRISVYDGKRSNKAQPGCIISFDPDTDLHTVRFDRDGHEERLALNKVRFRWLVQAVEASVGWKVQYRVGLMNSHVGRRVEIYSSAAGRRKTPKGASASGKKGKVVGFDEESGKHRIRFDRGNRTSSVRLEKGAFRWLDVAVETHSNYKKKAGGIGSSRFLGVRHCGVSKKWEAFGPLEPGGRPTQKYIGTFASEKDAALAHDVYARKHGCAVNFPDEEMSETKLKERKLTRNMSISKTRGKSKFRGVYWQKNRKRWMARYTLSHKGRKNVNLGAFLEAKHAALAWDAEARKRGRTRDSLNFPDEHPTDEEIKALCANSAHYRYMRSGHSTSSQYRGVTRPKKADRVRPWRAQVNITKIKRALKVERPGPYNIGFYRNEKQAALAFDRLCRAHGVPETELNFPRNVPLPAVRTFDKECYHCHSRMPKDAVSTPCSHIFCRHCITSWLEEAEMCPCCQTPMTSEVELKSVSFHPLATSRSMQALSAEGTREPTDIGDCSSDESSLVDKQTDDEEVSSDEEEEVMLHRNRMGKKRKAVPTRAIVDSDSDSGGSVNSAQKETEERKKRKAAPIRAIVDSESDSDGSVNSAEKEAEDPIPPCGRVGDSCKDAEADRAASSGPEGPQSFAGKTTRNISPSCASLAPAIGIGWKTQDVQRTSSERVDRYWFSPGGHKFRSSTEVRLFREALSTVGNDEDAAWAIFKGREVVNKSTKLASGRTKAIPAKQRNLLANGNRRDGNKDGHHQTDDVPSYHTCAHPLDQKQQEGKRCRAALAESILDGDSDSDKPVSSDRNGRGNLSAKAKKCQVRSCNIDGHAPKRLCKHPTAQTQNISSPSALAVPAMDIGWKTQDVQRAGSKRVDRYWFSPGGHKFRSSTEVKRFKEALGKAGNDEDAAWAIFKDRVASRESPNLAHGRSKEVRTKLSDVLSEVAKDTARKGQDNGHQGDGDSKCPSAHDGQRTWIGRRIAKMFGTDIYFGEVEAKLEGRGMFRVSYDDGDDEDLPSCDTLKAMSLYDHCKKVEMKDPERAAKIEVICQKFYDQKSGTLSRIPSHIKSHFCQVGFAEWSGKFLPALFLGPYDVSPGPIRDRWLQVLERCSAEKRAMPRLMYWYGCSQNLGEAFSFLPASKCISYDEGAAKGLCSLPDEVKAKIEAKKRLSAYDLAAVRAWDEMAVDVAKSPRTGAPFLRIREDHERLRDGSMLLVEFEAAERNRAEEDDSD